MFFYQCNECDNIVFSKNEKNIECCKKEMVRILPNQVLEGEEMEDIHFLRIRKIGVLVSLEFEAPHPMLEVHHLKFAILETDKGFYYRDYNPGDTGMDFLIHNEEQIINAYVFCNQFGLIEAACIDDLTK